MQPEPDDGEAGGADLGKLQTPRQDGHVVAVGKLAADAGEEEERADEYRAGERHQRLGVRTRDLEQDQKDERVLEEVVVEGREELAPEQRREAARGHQRVGHGAFFRGGRGIGHQA